MQSILDEVEVADYRKSKWTGRWVSGRRGSEVLEEDDKRKEKKSYTEIDEFLHVQGSDDEGNLHMNHVRLQIV